MFFKDEILLRNNIAQQYYNTKMLGNYVAQLYCATLLRNNITTQNNGALKICGLSEDDSNKIDSPIPATASPSVAVALILTNRSSSSSSSGSSNFFINKKNEED